MYKNNLDKYYYYLGACILDVYALSYTIFSAKLPSKYKNIFDNQNYNTVD